MLVGSDIAHRAANKTRTEPMMLIERCVEQVKLISDDVRADLDTTQQLIRRKPVGLPALRPKSQPAGTSPAHSPHTRLCKNPATCPRTQAGRIDHALLVIGFAAALPRSEVSQLQVAVIERHTNGLVLTIRRSKGDQHEAGQRLRLLGSTNHSNCPEATSPAPPNAPPDGS